jgi:hypothetical protein
MSRTMKNKYIRSNNYDRTGIRAKFARRTGHYLLVLSFFLPFSPFTPTISGAEAAEATGAERNAQLVTLLRSAKLINPSYELKVAISSDEIQITTQKKPKATADELKIQAVLLSKTAFDTISSGPQRVKLTFLDFNPEGYTEVHVKRAEVMLFGEGKLSQKDLLASLDITSSQVEGEAAAPGAVAGPLQTERTMALERINRLKAAGTNVTAFMKLFDEVEESAKKNDEEKVKPQLADLRRRLKDQEEILEGLAQRRKTSLQSTVAASANATAPPAHSTDEPHQHHHQHSGGGGNAFVQLFNNFAEVAIANYPPDMKATATRVLAELKALADHHIDQTGQYENLRVVGVLMDSGHVQEGRNLLNKVAQDADPEYSRLMSQQR